RQSADLLLYRLVFAAADVRQPTPLGPSGGLVVEIDGDPELLANPPADLPGQIDALRHGRLAERYERQDVGRAHAGVLAAVPVQVDQLCRSRHAAEGRVRYFGRRAREGEHRS